MTPKQQDDSLVWREKNIVCFGVPFLELFSGFLSENVHVTHIIAFSNVHWCVLTFCSPSYPDPQCHQPTNIFFPLVCQLCST